MYSTRSSARRVTMDDPTSEDASYNIDGDDVYETSPLSRGSSRARRGGHSILHGVKEPPRSMRLRRTSTSHSNSNPSYLEVDSDEENYYSGQVDDSQESLSIHQISRRSTNRSTATKVISCHSTKSEKSGTASDGRLTRNSRSRTSEQDPYSSNQKRSRDDERTVMPSEKRLRNETPSEECSKMEEVINEEDDDEDEEEEEEEEEEDTGRKYSLRDRDSSRRETMNISVLGGNGGGYDRRPSQGLTRALRSGEHVATVQPRLYLGAKIPNFAHARYRRSGNRPGKHDHHHQKGRNDGVRRHYDSSSDSSSDGRNSNRRDFQGRGRHGGDHGGGSEDAQFNRYESERLLAERDSVQPLTMGSMGAGGGDTGMGGSLRDKASQRDMLRADAAPVAVDPRLGFQSIGGLEKHVQALKEMVVLPLLYPDVFQRFDTQPPRGVLFVGPPGTGKTLTARALANSVTISAAQGGRKVSFFMRKGADCLSKWVGEGERQLRLLFEQAKRYQPSIIFFDEIDGLAPVRSVKQDQIHASIVSTLLALMDGLDARGQVVVIGATNRPDAIDPALRRPGRFDRELFFPLPDAKARAAIIEINTGAWQPSLSPSLKEWLVSSTAGYCGADLKALCAEAALVSLRRAYPQVYESTTRLDLDPSQLVLGKGDFAAALNKVVPASRRGVAGTPARPLHSIAAPLLRQPLEIIMSKIKQILPTVDDAVRLVNNAVQSAVTLDAGSDDDLARLERHANRVNQERLALEDISPSSETWIAALTDMQDNDVLMEALGHEREQKELSLASCSQNTTMWDTASVTSHPRLMIVGGKGMGQSDLVAAALQQLEGMPCFAIDHPSLLADLNAHSPEQALVNRVQEACKASPSVIYFPSVTTWWSAAPESMRSALLSLVEAMPSNLPVLWLSTMELSSVDDKLRVHSGMVVHEDEKLISLIAWLNNSSDNLTAKNRLPLNDCSGHTVILTRTVEEDRRALFKQFFDTLNQLPSRLYAARMQVIRARIQVRKPAVAAPEVVCDVSVTQAQAPKGPSRSLRSGLSCKDDKDKDNDSSSAPAQPIVMTEDGDKQCVRELRNFLRATLGELHKEKKCLVFWRPVDPESVPDYYDVISCPMDLETMRMKVDNTEYSTLSHFLRDIEQIVFNAKEYNPLTLKDIRGRSIVHAAHSMGDIVESHAYNFKKEVGYDLFAQCEEIAHRLHIPRPQPPRAGDTMSAVDAKYYSEILQVHERVRVEEGDQHPTALKLLELETRREEEELSRACKESEKLDQSCLDELADDKGSINKGGAGGFVGDSDESPSLEDESTDIPSSSSYNSTQPQPTSAGTEAEIAAASREVEEILVKEELERTDISSLPVMTALMEAMNQVADHDGLRELLVAKSADMNVSEIIATATGLYRLSREFQRSCDWTAFRKNLNVYCGAPEEQGLTEI